MIIAKSVSDVKKYMKRILAGGIENPVLVDKYMPGIELEVDVISDGKDVLIPGIMEHIERAGVHSGDSIAVYPPYNLTDKFTEKIVKCSTDLALALGTKGLVNIQYLIYDNELYVIEVNPRASRTVPYISKVTDVPMVDIASAVMLGKSLKEIGHGVGLAKIPPYCAVKVPVFSFEKLNDANSILGPEMKSTGEVLGIGKTLAEAMFKGLTAAGFSVPEGRKNVGVLISVEESDYQEVLSLAKRFFDLGMTVYATTGTAKAISALGIDVVSVKNATESEEVNDLLESGKLGYIVYTGAVKDATMGDYIVIHRRAMQLGVPCLTSLDTANAVLSMIESRFTVNNTELIDICNMRKDRKEIPFVKMHSCGNDYIFIENYDESITCPESLCVELCKEHYGIGADGIVLIEKSDKAVAKMRSFNKDGSEGRMAGNNIRCVAKYLYESGKCRDEKMSIETISGVHETKLYVREGKVTSVSVDMGQVDFSLASFKPKTDKKEMIDAPVTIDGKKYKITCVSVGNPHTVTFTDNLDGLDIADVGPKFEHNKLFGVRVNTEFVRVVDSTNLRVRVWERGNGATLACGTGACAAVVAATLKGYCKKNTDVKVSLPGGTLIVNWSDDGLILTGSVTQAYRGYFEY